MAHGAVAGLLACRLVHTQIFSYHPTSLIPPGVSVLLSFLQDAMQVCGDGSAVQLCARVVYACTLRIITKQEHTMHITDVATAQRLTCKSLHGVNKAVAATPGVSSVLINGGCGHVEGALRRWQHPLDTNHQPEDRLCGAQQQTARR